VYCHWCDRGVHFVWPLTTGLADSYVVKCRLDHCTVFLNFLCARQSVCDTRVSFPKRLIRSTWCLAWELPLLLAARWHCFSWSTMSSPLSKGSATPLDHFENYWEIPQKGATKCSTSIGRKKSKKSLSFRAATQNPVTSWSGALPLYPAGGSAPSPRYRLALRARHPARNLLNFWFRPW